MKFTAILSILAFAASISATPVGEANSFDGGLEGNFITHGTFNGRNLTSRLARQSCPISAQVACSQACTSVANRGRFPPPQAFVPRTPEKIVSSSGRYLKDLYANIFGNSLCVLRKQLFLHVFMHIGSPSTVPRMLREQLQNLLKNELESANEPRNVLLPYNAVAKQHAKTGGTTRGRTTSY